VCLTHASRTSDLRSRKVSWEASGERVSNMRESTLEKGTTRRKAD